MLTSASPVRVQQLDRTFPDCAQPARTSNTLNRCEEIVDLPISLEVTIFVEVTEAINQLKSSKAPNYDETDAEMLKAREEVMVNSMCQLYRMVWKR